MRIELRSRRILSSDTVKLVVSFDWVGFQAQLEQYAYMLDRNAYYSLDVGGYAALVDVPLDAVVGYTRNHVVESLAVQPSQENTVMSVARKPFLITVIQHKKDEDSAILFNATAVAANEQHATLLAARKIPTEISDSDLARVEIVVKAL